MDGYERIKVDGEADFAEQLDGFFGGSTQQGPAGWSVHLLEESYTGPFAHSEDDGAPRLEVSRCERVVDGIGRQTWKAGGVLTWAAADATRSDLLDALGPGRYDVVLRHRNGTVIARKVVPIGAVPSGDGGRRVGHVRRDDPTEQPAQRESVLVAELRAQLAADRERHDAEVRRIQERAESKIRAEREDRDDAVRRIRETADDHAGRLRSELEYCRGEVKRERELRTEAEDECRKLRRQIERGGGRGGLEQMAAFAEEAQAAQEQLQTVRELLGGSAPAPEAGMGDMVADSLNSLDGLLGKVGMAAATMKLLKG